MGVSIVRHSDPIRLAYSALLKEQVILQRRIARLQARLRNVERAITTLKPLTADSVEEDAEAAQAGGSQPLQTAAAQRLMSLALGHNPESEEEEEEEEEDEEHHAQEPGNRFAGMPFSIALKNYMDLMGEPKTTSQLASGFEHAGWRFNSPTQSAKVNQVGVTLRRFEGKYFRRAGDGLWASIQQAG